MDTNKSESSHDYQAIVERVPAIVYIAGTGENGVWHYVNEWIQPILGFTVEEWTSDPTLWSRQLHSEDRDKALAAEVESATQFGAASSADDSASYFLDYRMLHKDGHVVWIRDSSVVLPGVDGTPLWHGVLMDISDQKLIEQQLERRRAAQATVARLGEQALAGTPIPDLLAEACRAAAEVLEIEAATVAQTGEERNSLELRAEYGCQTETGSTHAQPLAIRCSPARPYSSRTGTRKRASRVPIRSTTRTSRAASAYGSRARPTRGGCSVRSPPDRMPSPSTTSTSSSRSPTSWPTRSSDRTQRTRCSIAPCTTR
jgi:PAS domain S-box-containing protein